ncbi:3-[(3aS,4S,7aS)-7a-methyl-1,5-dioxo-octahydro-1H-inden-4-yl]propanoyl:CoA ligase-like [Haliotis rubra]|uniref:3-[(3aS,4S,7aS)-7a-methyl-1, 5-dioxo-octahydro-1H-inden-4-yl]propanoyl:CoA ligase-like n=1 Tax=Haliotis rubra TaxID=36100 RepID=UPI001EE59DDF|nr:3-[(3aS,4S,7aS)-7a-methyl-1,5-dioxo-octahydro-1H-inden-4-yl]propanoyl:CoA ligase-like [Haliotis rubra]
MADKSRTELPTNMADTDHQRFDDETIVNRIQYWGRIDSNKPAFIFWSSGGRFVLSRGDVLDMSSRFAHRLTKMGLKPGDAACVALPNSPERIVAEFGVQLAGAVSMNGQVLREDGSDLADSIKRTGCKILISDLEGPDSGWNVLRKYFSVLESGMGHLKVQSDHVSPLEIVQLCRIKRDKDGFLASLTSEPPYVYDGSKSTDLASIFTTSGSSGYSKLVKQSHRNILNNAYLFTKSAQVGTAEKIFLSAPLGWIGGYPAFYLGNGCIRVLVDVGAGPVADLASLIWNIVHEEDVSVFAAMPFHIELLYQKAKEKGFNRPPFKNLMSAGQPIKQENLRALGFLSDSLQTVYGSTEVGLAATLNVNKDSVDVFIDNTAGYPVPGAQVKVACEAEAAPENENRGEILVKTHTLSMGYIGDESKVLPMSDGWFHTGDIGYMNKDGSIVVEGRSSDAIMHGAYIIYPTWLEKVLVPCPGVQQVVIVPVPDEIMHHEICACVKPEPGAEITAEDVIVFCKKQFALDPSSSLNVVPKYVLFFDNFPLTRTSKLDRKSLTAEAALKLS